jgi:hypothetical protein
MTSDEPQREEPPRPWQFRLRTVFVLTTVAAIVAAAATGVFGTVAARGAWGLLAAVVIWLAFVAFVLGLTFTSRAVDSMRERRGKQSSKDNQPRD